MDDEPLLTVKGHIDGKMSEVTVFANRVEWTRPRGFSRKKKDATETIPIRSVSSVTTGRERWGHKVSVICSGNTIDIKTMPKDAEALRDIVTQLVLGTHPAQQADSVRASAASAVVVDVGVRRARKAGRAP